MDHSDEKPQPAAPKTVRKPGRAERLAEELRANLRRRKDQARSRASAGEPDPAAPDAIHDDDRQSGKDS